MPPHLQNSSLDEKGEIISLGWIIHSLYRVASHALFQRVLNIVVVISLEAAPNVQFFWSALPAAYGYTLCNQLPSAWTRTAAFLSHPASSLSSIPLSVLIASQVFSFSTFHIPWYISNGRIQCLCLMKVRVVCEWLGRWLACSCALCCLHTGPWASPPSITLCPEVFRGAAVTAALPETVCL